MRELFAVYPALAWSLVGVMLALVVVASLWERLKWWWLNTWMNFPVIGRIARLSGDTASDTRYQGWLKSETTLCDEYRKFINIQDEHDFKEKIRYLTKAGDNGRKPVPGLIWLLTVAMVFVEAMGFSYVLAGYTLPGASENMQQVGAYGIAFLISIILVALTHFAGHELYVSSKIANARRQWQENGRVGAIRAQTIALADAQSIDDDKPGYTQLMSRVGTDIPSYKVTILTAVFVLFVAVFATYVRGQVLEKSLHQEVIGASSQSASNGFDGLDFSMDAALPVADLTQDRDTLLKVAQDEANIDRHGGWATFIVLAFVFVFLQILGVLFGYRWGFAGQNSASAYRAIGSGRYSTYADVRKHYEQIADTAQAKLSDLQQRLINRNAISGTRGIEAASSFYDYMKQKRYEQTGDRHDERMHTENEAARRQVKSQATTTDSASVAAVVLDDVADDLRKIESLADKNEKLFFIQSLPEARQVKVKQALKAAKEARERLAAELDDLL